MHGGNFHLNGQKTQNGPMDIPPEAVLRLTLDSLVSFDSKRLELS